MTIRPPVRHDISDLVAGFPYTLVVTFTNAGDDTVVDFRGRELRAQIRGPGRQLRGDFDIAVAGGLESPVFTLTIDGEGTEDVVAGDRWDLLVIDTAGRRRYYIYGFINDDIDGGAPGDLGGTVDGGDAEDDSEIEIDGGGPGD